ncbi:hypothetical protein [Flavicella sp.]|uniref:hypothetical protein n=1 Tax=Flavicella sp. TaxID=2957742 RepID=UPI003019B1F4
MKKFCFLAFLSLLLACDDGEYNIPSFDFDGLTINDCGEIVFSKITSSGTESLILQINEDNTDDVFFKTAVDTLSISIAAGTDNTMYYRIFDSSITTSSYFCQEIPPSTPLVTEEWFGEGTLYITNTITLDDDNDGIVLINESTSNEENNNTNVDYLNVNDNKPITAVNPVTNTYSYSYTMLFEFTTLTLYNETSTINYSNGYTYGTKTGTFTSSELLFEKDEDE